MMRFLSGRVRELPEQDRLEWTGDTIAYRIRESSRRRTLGLELRTDGSLTVAVPSGAPLELVRRFVLEHRHWIESRRARLADMPRNRLVFESGARLPWLGGTLVLDLQLDARAAGRCRREGDTLVVRARNTGDARRITERWYRQLAASHFAERITHFAPIVGRAPSRITVRAQRTRWGSCTRRGSVSLNWRLMQGPTDIIDYVIVHELSHLLVPNHSPRFWAQVARVLPDWRERRRALHVFGRSLVF